MNNSEKNVESISENPSKILKPFFFIMKVCHHRTDEVIAKRCGVVFAENEEAAENLAWEKYGNNSTCGLEVWKIPEEGTSFVVYKCTLC